MHGADLPLIKKVEVSQSVFVNLQYDECDADCLTDS